MQFTPGDRVVHPRHGVGTVTAAWPGRDGEEYLHLSFETGGLTIAIPLSSVDEVGIRQVASRDHAHEILATLEESSHVPAAWGERNAETSARMRSARLDEAALVIRDLTRHGDRLTKPLSASEKGVLDQCLATVVEELSIALDLPPDEVRDTIAEKIGRGSSEVAQEA